MITIQHNTTPPSPRSKPSGHEKAIRALAESIGCTDLTAINIEAKRIAGHARAWLSQDRAAQRDEKIWKGRKAYTAIIEAIDVVLEDQPRFGLFATHNAYDVNTEHQAKDAAWFEKLRDVMAEAIQRRDQEKWENTGGLSSSAHMTIGSFRDQLLAECIKAIDLWGGRESVTHQPVHDLAVIVLDIAKITYPDPDQTPRGEGISDFAVRAAIGVFRAAGKRTMAT